MSSTPDIVNWWLAKWKKGKTGSDLIMGIRHIKCIDGFTMSVQASQYMYCEPRVDVGPWRAVEVGFPSMRVEEFMKYAEDRGDPTQTVYNRVPVAVVNKVIQDHGGIDTTFMRAISRIETNDPA
jgi:hypothetical protein